MCEGDSMIVFIVLFGFVVDGGAAAAASFSFFLVPVVVGVLPL